MYDLAIGSTLNIDVALNGGAADSGVTYAVAPGCESVISVNASTGVVTPAAAGVGVVLVKNASNAVVRRIAVSVVPAAEKTIREQLASGAITLAQGIAAANQ